MLKQRLLSGFAMGLVGVAIVLLDIFFERGNYYFHWLGWRPRGLLTTLLATGLAIMALREFYRLARAASLRPFVLVGVVLSIFLFLENCAHSLSGWGFWLKSHQIDFTLPVLAAGLAVAFVLQFLRWGTKGAFGNIGATLLGVIYIGLLGSFLVRIRQMTWMPEESYSSVRGAWHLAVFVATIKMTDVCAYFCGKRAGKHKLIVSVSPGKTVEGLIGGLAGGVITCVILCRLTFIISSIWMTIVLGLVLAGMGQLGDLAESIFKRDAREKDSSDSLPGFGGFLDVIDSLLLAAPVAYLIFALLSSR